ncbi:hypothetical protein AVEN_155932-1 [Araneus ventricosus]|uniref:Uncharacterized protein n=1 Tax=Araneus ventricosus TaxID=182803 RepID=A0A4Y2R4N5_ARAVE|nr:hypothetical protein AVEN_5603-1 [Araneus ventricosus]GBN70586.1 hypothetical protein AVEN_155932-1 [Araneus ventricosus]
MEVLERIWIWILLCVTLSIGLDATDSLPECVRDGNNSRVEWRLQKQTTQLYLNSTTFILIPIRLTLSMRDRPNRPFKQKTVDVRISLESFHPLSISMIDFTPAAHAFFVRVPRPEGFGELGWGFLEFGERQLSLRFLGGEVNFPYL